MNECFTKVTIIQRRLTHYRGTLFEKLQENLQNYGIKLRLLIGMPSSDELQRKDSIIIPWAESIPTYYFFRNRLCWQPIHKYVYDSDLVIVTQENSLLANHLLILCPRKFKVAFWGHGANFQSNKPNGFRERYKRWLAKRVDWWFAYTQLSADIVNKTGFPVDKITVLNNTIDILSIQKEIEMVTMDEILSLRHSLELDEGPIAVFVGSLYENKRLDFLFEAAELIRQKVKGFQLLIIGDGPERNKVKMWCDKHYWIKWTGAQFGRNKVILLSMAKILLNPGLVGLNILESFATGVPMLTTDCKIHSPEIAYLENEYNGLITINDLSTYVNTAIDILNNSPMLNDLKKVVAAPRNTH